MRQFQPPPIVTPYDQDGHFSKGWNDWFIAIQNALSKTPSFQIGVHTDRLKISAASVVTGSVYRESDRSVVYMALATAWVYLAGTMFGLAASKPSDLATLDAGFQYYATDTPALLLWNGAGWVTA